MAQAHHTHTLTHTPHTHTHADTHTQHTRTHPGAHAFCLDIISTARKQAQRKCNKPINSARICIMDEGMEPEGSLYTNVLT